MDIQNFYRSFKNRKKICCQQVFKGLSLFLFGAFFLFAFSANAQTVYENYQDGAMWFKLQEDRSIIGQCDGPRENASVDCDPRDIDPAKFPFLDDIVSDFEIARIARPFHYVDEGAKHKALQRTYKVIFNDAQRVDELVDRLAVKSAVDYAEKKTLMRTTYSPNDPEYPGNMWHLPQVNAANAWDISKGSSDIVVAVSDNAIDIDHEDLTNVTWNNSDETENGQDSDGNGYTDDVNGYDVADGDNDVRPADNNTRHGTHTSGTVGAETDNSTGVASLGFGVTVMPIKIGSGGGGLTGGTESISYAAENDAHVLSMSWGGGGSSSTQRNAIDNATSQGTICIAAAGNDDTNSQFYPAGYDNCISVGATNKSDGKASFSNYGSWLDISAPGVDILSTVPGNSYSGLQGTSMACPNVAGLVGLMLSLNPDMTKSQVEDCLYNTAASINWQGGAGRIDAEAAMQCVQNKLDRPPKADFEANLTTILEGESVNFTDLSKYQPNSWDWTFNGGNPGSSTDQNPSNVTYSTAGTYDVSLTASNANGTDDTTKTDYIEVLKEVTVDGEVIEGCTQNAVENAMVIVENADLSDTASTDANGNFSVSVAEGTYDVIVSKWGYETKVKNKQFDANNKSVTVELQKGYMDDFSQDKGWTTAINDPNVDVGRWERGEPNGVENNGTLTTPDSDVPEDRGKKAYVTGNKANASPGDDDVDNSVVTLSSPQMDLSNMDDPTLAFSFWFFNDYGNGTPNDSLVVIIDNGNKSVRAVRYTQSMSVWRKDQVKITDHVALTSNVQVSFEASDVDGEDQNVVNAAIDSFRVTGSSSGSISAGIDADTTTGCEGLTVNFTGNPSSATSYEWDLPGGNPNSSTSKDPSVDYDTAGTYDVQLIAKDGCTGAADTLTKSSYIDVSSAPGVTASASEDSVCSSATVDLSASSPDSPGYEWSGSGLSCTNCQNPTATVNSTTTYVVTASNNNGCSNEDSVTVVVDNSSSATASYDASAMTVCQGDSVDFDGTISQNASSYDWTFNGGSPSTSTDARPSVKYDQTGTYDFTLTVSNSCGTTDDTTGTIEVTDNTLAVDYTASSTTVCEGETVDFDASGSSNATDYDWTFNGGDISSSTQPAPSVTYTSSGTHSFSLTVTNACGKEKDTSGTVTVNPKPTGSASLSSSSVCVGGSVQYDASGSTDADSVRWTFQGGDKSSSMMEQVTVNYDQEGTMTYTLEAFNSCGVDSVSGTIEVNPEPTAAASVDMNTVCEGQSVQFDASGSQDANSYDWSFDGGTPATSQLEKPFVQYDNKGAYGYMLVVSNDCGSDTVNGSINVEECTAIEEQDGESPFASYFDPVGNKVVVSTGGEEVQKVERIEVVNSTGQVVTSLQPSDKTRWEVDMTAEAEGIYFLRVISEAGVHKNKFVK